MSTLFVAWRTPDPAGGWGPVARLDFDEDVYRFSYTRGAQTLEGFRPFPQMERFEQVYESDELLPLFANRLLSKSRPEYEAFLRWGGFDPSNPPDPIAILGVTEGLRQTDSIEVFPCPQPDAEGCYLNKFFLHGVRWMPQPAIDRVGRLNSGERLLILPDVCNEYDRNAVAVRTDDERMLIGYVPRYLARDVWHLLRECDPDFIRLEVERLNPDAPLQQRLLCRMNACWPDEFRPCSSEDFQPIASGLSQPCMPRP